MWIVLYCYETTCIVFNTWLKEKKKKETRLPFADHLIGLVSRTIEFRNGLLGIRVFRNAAVLPRDAHLINFENTENDAFRGIFRQKC